MKLWDAATGALLRTFEGHSDWVNSVAFSPDGSRVLSGSYKTIKLWDAATGALCAPSRGILTAVFSVAFSPDGARVLSGSFDKTMKLWDAATGALVRTLRGTFRRSLRLRSRPMAERSFPGSADTSPEFGTRQPAHNSPSSLAARWTMAGDDAGRVLRRVGQGDRDARSRARAGAYSVMRFYDHLYRSDLVEAVLNGDPEGSTRKLPTSQSGEVLDSGPAPRIEHLEGRTERRGDTVKLAVRIVDAGGGIGARVVWRVNGQTQGNVEPGELKGAQTPSLGAFPLTETLRIEPGKDNIVELTAYNGKGLLATPPLRITVPKFGATAEERPRMHVLAIGVDKYRMPDLKLNYAANDASRFCKALEEVGGGLFAQGRDHDPEGRAGVGEAIAAAFHHIGADAKPGDVFVLYLAGHGTSIEGKLLLLSADARLQSRPDRRAHGIGQDKWQAWLAKVGHVEKSCSSSTPARAARPRLWCAVPTPPPDRRGQLKHATGQNLIAASRNAAYEGYRAMGCSPTRCSRRCTEGRQRRRQRPGWGSRRPREGRVPRSPRNCSVSNSGRSAGCRASTSPSASASGAEAGRCHPQDAYPRDDRAERVRQRPAADARERGCRRGTLLGSSSSRAAGRSSPATASGSAGCLPNSLLKTN